MSLCVQVHDHKKSQSGYSATQAESGWSLPPTSLASHTSDSDTHIVETGGNEERVSTLQEPLLAPSVHMADGGGGMKDEEMTVVEMNEQYKN